MDIRKYYVKDGEEPLDVIASDGGFCSIFRTIACIGDSLSSGEFETVDETGTHNYFDMYEYSWGQFIARKTGSTVYNLSRGGMTAKEYAESFADEMERKYPQLAAQAYIIALGVNDKWQEYVTGSADDLDAPTFAGYYAQIIRRVRKASPRSKLFLVTEPRHSSDTEAASERKAEQRAVLSDFCAMFHDTYLIDLYKYAPVYDEEFKRCFYLNGHMAPMGYKLSADMIASYIDYIIRSRPEEFYHVGFINSGGGTLK